MPIIHKRLYDVPGRPVISNYGTPTEKVYEFPDYYLKPVIQNGLSYIRDSGHFLEKIDGVGEIPENTLFATTYVVSLYPSTPHKTGLSAVKEALHK